MPHRLKEIILKPYFIAFCTAVVVAYFSPSPFNKYEINLVRSGIISPPHECIVYHADIDNDGNSERIISYANPRDNRHSIQIFSSDGGTIDQWNFQGELNVGKGARLVTGDYDQDSLLEIYVFYRIIDTVFMDCFEPLDTQNPFELNKIKMFELTHEYAPSDCVIQEIFFKDINGDKKGEIILNVSSGKARFPRGIIAYDIQNEHLFRTPKFGVGISNLQITDLDGDGYAEIFGSIGAAGNVHDSLGVPYSDYSAWIMMFDHKLDLKFKPIEFPGFRSVVRMFPYKDTLVAAHYFHAGPNENKPELFLFNSEGDIVKRKSLPDRAKVEQNFYVNPDDKHTFMISQRYSSKVLMYDQHFDNPKVLDFQTPIGLFFKADLGDEMFDEHMFLGAQSELIITNSNYKSIAKYKLPNPLENPRFSMVRKKDQGNLLYVQNNSKFYEFQFGNNPLAPFRYAFYFTIFLIIWLFILVVNKLQMLQMAKKNRIRKQIVDLQLKNIKSQMDPHFTFNVFNTIADLIKTENPKAYQPFMKFSNLVRNTLVSSDRIVRTIDEEVNFLENYLELEKLRFPDLFNFQINIDPAVDTQTQIPKMLLHTYIENSIKHGLKPLKRKGCINISIKKEKSFYVFEVVDDGVGRKKAMEISSDSTGFGLQIMENYFKLFNDYNHSKIQQVISDASSEITASPGTRVVVKIPVNFSYNFR